MAMEIFNVRLNLSLLKPLKTSIILPTNISFENT